MKLIKVEYLEESSEAIFFDVMFEKKGFFTMPKIYNKRCFMEKTGTKSYFKFSEVSRRGQTFRCHQRGS